MGDYLGLDSAVQIDIARGLKLLYGQNLVVHCHHYNGRIQSTIEKFEGVEGKEIIREAAREVYFSMATDIFCENPEHDKAALCQALFSLIGLGRIESFLETDSEISQTVSHYVEGWRCGTVKTHGPVCTVTEGFLSGCLQAMTGEPHRVVETACMNEGSQKCKFSIERGKSTRIKRTEYQEIKIETNASVLEKEAKSNIDRYKIIEAVAAMPLYGNDNGLIPAFGVYLANTPQDFYNLVCMNFLSEASKIGMGEEAEMLLVEDAEFCGLNTFYGILRSEEWAALVKPMIQEEGDTLFGLFAVANALGWGRFVVSEHTPAKTLSLDAMNSYEGTGMRQLKGKFETPTCYMLQGVCSGLMSLVYQRGELEDRAGTFHTREYDCVSQGKSHCHFETTEAN